MNGLTTEWLANLREATGAIGHEVYNAFILPADMLITYLRSYTPGGLLPATTDDSILRIGVAVLFWLIAVALAWKLVKFSKNVVRTSNAMLRTACFLLVNAARSLKTRLICTLRPRLARRRSAQIASALEIEFNSLDLAVLRAGAGLPPGFALSAPDLAARLTMRPAQVQRSLDKLRSYRLIECALGSVEGYETYRLSPSAISMQEVWNKRLSVPAAVRPLLQ